MTCRICEQEQKGLLYKNDKVLVVLNDEPCTMGHVQIFPAQHFSIIEQLPDSLVRYLFQVANKVSTILFETLGCMGTNMIVENGVAAGQSLSHFSVNIIPRRENDGLNFQWNPIKLTEDELSTIHLALSESTKSIVFESEKAEPIEMKNETLKIESSKENYMIKQLERLP